MFGTMRYSCTSPHVILRSSITFFLYGVYCCNVIASFPGNLFSCTTILLPHICVLVSNFFPFLFTFPFFLAITSSPLLTSRLCSLFVFSSVPQGWLWIMLIALMGSFHSSDWLVSVLLCVQSLSTAGVLSILLFISALCCWLSETFCL